MKNKKIYMVVLLITMLLFSIQVVNAKELNTPIIKSFDTIKEEANALKIEIDSNGNTGNDFSYEIINSTLKRTNNISGSANYYVYQGLEKNKEYKVIVRACSNSSSSYICSNWTDVKTAIINDSDNSSTPDTPSTLKTPVLTKLTAQSTSSIKLDYQVSSDASGVEIYNINDKKAIETNNKKSYTVNNLVAGTSYKFKIRAYKNINNKTIYSAYTSIKTATTKSNTLVKPTLTKLTSTSKSVTLKYTTKGKVTGVEIYNITTKQKKKVSNKKTYTWTGLKANTSYKFKIRSIYKKDNKNQTSAYTVAKSIKTKNKTLKKPVLKQLKSSSKTNSIKLTYKVNGTVTGVEIYNITKNKKYKTKNKTNYTEKNLSVNKTYKYKIRTYLTKNNTTIYSPYTRQKSAKIKVSSSEMIARAAETLAWSEGTSRSIYHHNYSKKTKFTKWSQLGEARPTKRFQNAYDQVRKNHWKIGESRLFGGHWGYWTRIGASCDVFVATSIRYSGYDTSFPFLLGSGKSEQLGYMKKSKKWKKVSSAKRGDVCYNSRHILIYLGNGKIAEAGLTTQRFGKVYKGTCGSNYVVYRAK